MTKKDLIELAITVFCLFSLFIYIQGIILKNIIRQAIKDAFAEMGISKKTTNNEY